ncbi:AraC family transcriptional regulator [Pulveribacter suum]|uniref:AraC family transcriptional regulator n=1 Tax=Pulveribacter suum TaxID=2116657 RepID=A0A2P1NIM0_9BURK|nr:AraC family transcriptional regulator [Pulveribacter suum]AVP56903.1 AraC family transcriptional regulator [Pulveribacter suum]
MYTPSLPSSRPSPRRSARQGAVAATPMAFVQAVALAYARRGMDPAGALAQAQIAPEQVADDAARITAWQMEALCGAAMRELDDEALGWFERRLPWGSYGLLARASLSAPTLGLALARWCRHHGLLTQSIALRLSSDGARAELAIDEQLDLGPLREFCLVSVLRNVLGLASWFIDARLPVLGAQFPFAAPAHAGAYRVLFTGPTQFGAERAALQFDARHLQLPLVRGEAAMDALLQHALPLTVRQYRRHRLLVQRVRQLLAAAPQAAHSAQTVAQQLHLSPRTLHRQLAAEGATLQQLKDEVRRARATELLHRSDRPIKQVAQAAGFASEKSFIRAFKGWTGQSPAEFRQRSRPAG